jgi:hypothetical protein
MSSCFFPLEDFVDDEGEISKEPITEEVMEEINSDIDWEIKRAVNEVVRRLQEGV